MMGPGDPASRSISAETTFERDCSDRECVEDVLMSLSDELSYRLWSEGYTSRTLVLKLRLHDFTTITRRLSRASSYLTSSDAFQDALDLLERAWDGRTEIRLLGLCFAGVSKRDAGVQGDLFGDEGSSAGASERRRKAEDAVFEIERKGMARSLVPGSSATSIEGAQALAQKEGKRRDRSADPALYPFARAVARSSCLLLSSGPRASPAFLNASSTAASTVPPCPLRPSMGSE